MDRLVFFWHFLEKFRQKKIDTTERQKKGLATKNINPETQ